MISLEVGKAGLPPLLCAETLSFRQAHPPFAGMSEVFFA